MVCSPKYKGTYKYKDVVVEDGMPAIVDQKLFDEIQYHPGRIKQLPE